MPSFTVEDWAEDADAFYKKLYDVKAGHIFHGYKHNEFSIECTIVSDAFAHMLEKIVAETVEDLPKALQASMAERVKSMTLEIATLSEGVAVKTTGDATYPKEKKVRFPYARSIRCALDYAQLQEEILRYRFYINVLEDKNDEYKLNESEKLKLAEILHPLSESDVTLLKIVNQLVDWDREYTKRKLQDENRPVDTFHINKAMLLPGFFQHQFADLVWEDLLADESASDAIIIPSFAPLNIEFFNRTRSAPVYVMGMFDDLFIFADGYRHTQAEFCYHDLKHAWDMELFEMMSIVSTGYSRSALSEVETFVRDHIMQALRKLEGYEVDKCCYDLLLFELVHEEGHSYEPKNLIIGLKENSIYCKDFAGRLAGEKLATDFFGAENPMFKELIPQFQRCIDNLVSIIEEAASLIDIKPTVEVPPGSRYTDHHPACTVKLEERSALTDSGDAYKSEKLLPSKFRLSSRLLAKNVCVYRIGDVAEKPVEVERDTENDLQSVSLSARLVAQLMPAGLDGLDVSEDERELIQAQLDEALSSGMPEAALQRFADKFGGQLFKIPLEDALQLPTWLHLKFVLSENGLKAISQNFISIEEVGQIKDPRYLAYLFSENGLEALEKGWLKPATISSFHHPVMLKFVTSTAGVERMREAADMAGKEAASSNDAVEKMIKLGRQSTSDLLSYIYPDYEPTKKLASLSVAIKQGRSKFRGVVDTVVLANRLGGLS